MLILYSKLFITDHNIFFSVYDVLTGEIVKTLNCISFPLLFFLIVVHMIIVLI